MDNDGLNNNSRANAFGAVVKAVVLYKIGYFDDLKRKRTERTDVAQSMGIVVAQDGSYTGMDSLYLDSTSR